MKIRLFPKIGLLILTASFCHAEIEYPFNVPENISATLRVNTQKKRPFNNMLLGLNCSWPERLYGSTGFNNPMAPKVFKAFNPPALRWPHGVWANFYDWESDGRRLNDDYKTPYNKSVTKNPHIKYGFEGLTKLHEELKFNVIFTWNINYDSPEKGVRRFLDRREKGFDIKCIELGNETFWKTQRSEAVKDVQKYIAVSKAHAAALKKVDPNLKVSINATWRDAINSDWNQAIAEEDYYDAVTLHKYIGHPKTTEGAKLTLNARQEMIAQAETMQKVFPSKPIWLTEWAIGGGENAAAVLGLADTYLGIFSRPDIFELASYFQINAHHPLVHYDQKTRIHTQNSFAATYKIIRDVFQDSQLLTSSIQSPELSKGLSAVSAQAVVKDNKTIIFAINKTNRSLPLRLEIDGKVASSVSNHETLAFANIEDFKTYSMEETALINIPTGKSGIVLPPLSLNRIELSIVTE